MLSIFLVSLSCFLDVLVAQENPFDHPNFFQFVTRPDISVPKWDIEVYDEEALAPGYWFVAPYENLIQHSYPKWNGPSIWDPSNGELIWSGAQFVQFYNTFDFRMSHVDGKEMLSFIWPKNSDKQEGGFILDETYTVHKLLDMRGDDQIRPNMHDFNLIDDGKRALMLTTPHQHESHITVPGEFDGMCKVDRQGFKELDVASGEVLFEWNSEGHIGVEESTYFNGMERVKSTYTHMCSSYWDITHFNAIDKFDDGDYLLSSRHMDTIYKVSHIDGKILWRLGGVKSDFVFKDQRAKFTRQHHARFRGQNSTHTLVSLFDNARGDIEAKASSFESWGLLIALRTDVTPMTVELVSRYQKPFGSGNPREKARGTVSFLRNGNAFVGWVTGSQISEYTRDGRMLMHAMFRIPEAASYRSYKMPWIGRPAQPPDVVAEVTEDGTGQLATVVHVSWNGDTEARTWNVLRTNPSGDISELVASSAREGFETKLSIHGFAKHIVTVALDSRGQEIGRSKVITVDLPPRFQSPTIATEEAEWIQSHSSAWQAETIAADNPLSASKSPIFGLILLGAVSFVLTVCFLRRKTGWRRSRKPTYEFVPSEDDEDIKERYDQPHNETNGTLDGYTRSQR